MRFLAIMAVALVAACQTGSDLIGRGPIALAPTAERCFSKYMTLNGLSFALSEDGHGCGYVSCRFSVCYTDSEAMAKAMVAAIQNCEEKTHRVCKVYANQKDIVWQTTGAGGPTRLVDRRNAQTLAGRTGPGGDPKKFTGIRRPIEFKPLTGKQLNAGSPDGNRLTLKSGGFYTAMSKDGASSTSGLWGISARKLCFSPSDGETDGPRGCFKAELNDTLDQLRLTDSEGNETLYRILG